MSRGFDVLGALALSDDIARNRGPNTDALLGQSGRQQIHQFLANSSPNIASQLPEDTGTKPCRVDASIILSWIYRGVWCAPMALIQWLPLALNLVQLTLANDPRLPSWITGMIQPDLFLVTYSLIHMLVTVFIVNPPMVVDAIKFLVSRHQQPKAGCSRQVMKFKLAAIMLVAIFGTIAGGFAFYPIIGDLPILSNSSYPFLVSLINTMSSMPVLWQIMWWSYALWIYAPSGINFAEKTVDLVAFYFRAPKVRDSHRIVKKMKNVGFDPEVLHSYVRMIKEGYIHHLANLPHGATREGSLEKYLTDIQVEPKDLLTTVIRKKLRESTAITNHIAQAAVIVLTIAIAWGMLSFYLVAIQTLPIVVSLVEIAVSTGMINWLATSTVDFIRRLPFLSEKIYSWYLTSFHGAVYLLWLIYTSIGTVGEIFLETNPQLIELQTVSNANMIFLFNMPAVFFLFLEVERLFLKCSSSIVSKEKITWIAFEKYCHKQLLCALSDQFVASYLAEAFREKGEFQHLVFLYLWGNLPMSPPSSASRNPKTLTVEGTVRHLLEENQLGDSVLDFDIISQSGSHLGMLSNLNEASTIWRVVYDVIYWASIITAFSCFMSQYLIDIESPINRLLAWSDGKLAAVWLPLTILAVAGFALLAIKTVRFCLNKASIYRDRNAVCARRRGNQAIECGPVIENRITRVLAHLIPQAILAVPILYLIYFLLSNIAKVTVEEEIANFSASERRVVEGFTQVGMTLLFLKISVIIGPVFALIFSACTKQKPERSVSVFQMTERGGSVNTRATTIAIREGSEEQKEEEEAHTPM